MHNVRWKLEIADPVDAAVEVAIKATQSTY